ncbi:MAG: hypothetical protein PHQ75_12330 [Thermoguttaceae bacterium]|nr:hypothetical protein [Thermoguttaceae bacterium]
MKKNMRLPVKKAIWEQSQKYDCFYLYDEQRINAHLEQLKADFESIEFFYSIKANRAKGILRNIFSRGFGADAASLNEVNMANSLNVSASRIQYSAPGKQVADIRGALGIATIIADSIEEIRLIDKIAGEENRHVETGVRINPNFTFTDSTGNPSKFGIDEDQILAFLRNRESLHNLEIVGIHVHLRSQELQADILGSYYEKMYRLACSVQEATGDKLKFINMGSGLGIPYSTRALPLDTRKLGRTIAELATRFYRELNGTRIILETGRFLVGESGYYVTHVLDRKESMGKKFIILKNTLNGFLRPCIAQLITRYASNENLAGSEPLFTGNDCFQFIPLSDSTERETVSLVGNLCTAMDIVAEDIEMPRLKIGDVVAITNAGSYGAVLSPMQFSSQQPPAQLMLASDNTVVDADA